MEVALPLIKKKSYFLTSNEISLSQRVSSLALPSEVLTESNNFVQNADMNITTLFMTTTTSFLCVRNALRHLKEWRSMVTIAKDSFCFPSLNLCLPACPILFRHTNTVIKCFHGKNIVSAEKFLMINTAVEWYSMTRWDWHAIQRIWLTGQC